MRDRTQTSEKVFGSLKSDASIKIDTELKEVKDKLRALHDTTMEVEHKLTKTENRLEVVIREILESRKYTREIYLNQQQVNDRLLQGLERIEGWMLSKTSSLPAPVKDGLVTRESLIEETAITTQTSMCKRTESEEKTIFFGENEIGLVLKGELVESNKLSDKSVDTPSSSLHTRMITEEKRTF